MSDTNVVPFWFKHFFKKGKRLKLKTKLSLMSQDEIKRYFEKSLSDSLLYGISKEYEKALTIYILSDDSLKKELDEISMEVQNKKIDVNEIIIDAFAMLRPTSRTIAQVEKNALIDYYREESKRNSEEENIDP